MLLPKLERGDESDDGGMETSPRFTRGGFSTRIKVEPRVEAESWFVIGGFNENFVVMGEWLDGSPKQKKRSSLFTRWS
ncbi:hypothetical protein F2Q68_00043475 [Brassica cretica]|nr:hypothetical protein F2Q68_00043475 [Brassica cretica]